MTLESEGIPRKDIYLRLNKITSQQQRVLSEAMRQRRSRQRRAEAPARESEAVPAFE